MVTPHIKVQTEDFDVGAEFAALTAGRTDIGGIGCFVGTVRADAKNAGSKVTGVVTVSIGVCSERAMLNRTSEQLLNAADAALYRAKRVGRNCIQLA